MDIKDQVVETTTEVTTETTVDVAQDLAELKTYIDWRSKLSSRKFWTMLIAVFAAIGAVFGLSEGSIERVSTIIGAFATLIVFILTEGRVDVAREQSNAVDNINSVTNVYETEESSK